MSDTDQNTNATGDTQGSGAGAPAGSSRGLPLSAVAGGVNAQIVDAVNQSIAAVIGTAPDQGAAVAYQKVAQATAFAVQDATDYNRNIENIAMTAQGVIITKMLADEANIPIYTPVLATIQEMVIAATTNLASVGAASATVLSAFPSKAS